jgi:hypothetical protein
MPAIILPYKAASNSARNLATAIGCKRMKLRGSNRPDNRNLTIINWGNTNTDLSGYTQATVLNRDIRSASNKRMFFERVAAYNLLADSDPISIPDFTTSRREAQRWLNEGKTVVCRHQLAGHSGEGIEIVAPVEGEAVPTVPLAPLYTRYMKKRDEYRVHVIKGVVIDVQRKARNTSVADSGVNWQVRNHSNGFIFARSDVNPPQTVLDNAVRTVEALGLDFGAVDLIYQPRAERAFVLEVNTACGMEGTTLSNSSALSAVILGGAPQAWAYDGVVVPPLEDLAGSSGTFQAGDVVQLNRQRGGWSTEDVFIVQAARGEGGQISLLPALSRMSDRPAIQVAASSLVASSISMGVNHVEALNERVANILSERGMQTGIVTIPSIGYSGRSGHYSSGAVLVAAGSHTWRSRIQRAGCEGGLNDVTVTIQVQERV